MLILHFQPTGMIPPNPEPFRTTGTSISIGRGKSNDMVLPDPDKMISSNHCVIEDQGGTVKVIDNSTNGTFLNYGKVPLGRIPTQLADGDILSMGSYELRIEFAVEEPLAEYMDPLAGPIAAPAGMPAAPAPLGSILDDPGSSGDFLDDLLGGPELGAGHAGVKRAELGADGLMPPLGEDPLGPASEPAAAPVNQNPGGSSMMDNFQAPGVTAAKNVIPDDWDDEMFAGIGGATAPEPTPAPAPGAPLPADDIFAEPEEISPVPELSEETQVPAAAPVAVPTPAPAAGDTAARAFLNSAGAGELSLTDEELEPTLSRMGHVFRVMVHGMREILMTRASIKSEFRMNQTMISAGGNNPLKFSISPEQAIEAMVKPSVKGYLDATEAAEQALQDVKAHEIAMVTGMEAALKGILQKLDPKVLEGKITVSGGLGSVLKGKKARYWEVYEQMYSEIAGQAEDDFQELFAKEFSRAYQSQLEKLK